MDFFPLEVRCHVICHMTHIRDIKIIVVHLCPGLYAAAKFAIFRVLAKNRKNRKVDDFSRSLAIFRSC